MSPRLPSLFLQKTESLEAEFLHASRLTADGLKMRYTIAAQIKFEKFEQRAPQAAGFSKKAAKYLIKKAHIFAAAATFRAETMPDHAKAFFVPISLVTMPVLPAFSYVTGSIGASGLKGFCKEIKGEVTGNDERIKARKSLQWLDDNSDPQKHLILDAMP